MTFLWVGMDIFWNDYQACNERSQFSDVVVFFFLREVRTSDHLLVSPINFSLTKNSDVHVQCKFMLHNQRKIIIVGLRAKRVNEAQID